MLFHHKFTCNFIAQRLLMHENGWFFPQFSDVHKLVDANEKCYYEPYTENILYHIRYKTYLRYEN